MSNRFNNPDVCLVRNDAGDIIVFQAGGFQSSVGSGGHGCDRLLIRLFAQHLNGIELLVDVSGSNRATAPAARHEEDIGKLSITPHVCRDYAVRICAIPQNRCASPVAEKHAGVSIRPVDNRTELIGANYQDRVVDVRRNELLTDFHRVQESRAGSRHVKTGCMDGPQLLLDPAGSGGEKHVRSHGCHDDQIDLIGRDFRLLHCSQCGSGAHVARRLVCRCYPSLANSGTGPDPFVRRFNHLLEFPVGQDAFGYVTACADDRNRSSWFTGPARVWWRTSHCRIELPAKFVWVYLTFNVLGSSRIAFLIASGELAPWAMIQTPLTPSRGMPPYSS